MKSITSCILILSLFLFACENEDDTVAFPDNLELTETESSGCLTKKALNENTENGFFEYILNSNSIEIKHLYIYDHCGAEWFFEMEITDENTILIKEIDKATSFAHCLCYFNISTSIENLVGGINYKIEIWNEDMTELLDSRIFSI